MQRWTARSLLDQCLFFNAFRRVQLPEEWYRDWPEELERCQTSGPVASTSWRRTLKLTGRAGTLPAYCQSHDIYFWMFWDEFNFPKKDTEIDRTSGSATRPLDQLLISECFRRAQLPEEGCRDWQDELEHCQPLANPSNLLLNVFRRVQLPKEGCRDWPND